MSGVIPYPLLSFHSFLLFYHDESKSLVGTESKVIRGPYAGRPLYGTRRHDTGSTESDETVLLLPPKTPLVCRP